MRDFITYSEERLEPIIIYDHNVMVYSNERYENEQYVYNTTEYAKWEWDIVKDKIELIEEQRQYISQIEQELDNIVE